MTHFSLMNFGLVLLPRAWSLHSPFGLAFPSGAADIGGLGRTGSRCTILADGVTTYRVSIHPVHGRVSGGRLYTICYCYWLPIYKGCT